MKGVGNIKEKVGHAIHSSRGKSILLYLLFCAVAFIFWLMLTLDSEVQRDFEIPVELTGVPDTVTVITDVPPYINVSVKARGVQLLRFSWGRTPTLKIDFRTYNAGGGRVYLGKARLDARVREYFGSNALISSVKPDSIVVTYTSTPGIPVKLKVVADIRPDMQCIINGAIRANLDSVMVYSVNGTLPQGLTEVTTEPLVHSGLKDTTVYEVNIRPVKGLRIVPSHVSVTVPVEPLISKKRAVQIEVLNAPAHERVITFPSKVDVNYLVPMSMYNDEYPLRLTVDYYDTERPGDKLGVSIGEVPTYYHNISFTPDSVEYLIEKAQK